VQTAHWFQEPVRTIDTTLDIAPSLTPVFRRAAFGANRYHDLIVRAPRDSGEPLPVATVSKSYVLVQHAEAIGAVTREIENAGIDPGKVPARLLITEYGSRMTLRATLPAEFAFTPPDGHPMALTYECFNSVDRTVPLFAAVGWFRFVCSNGLLVGTTSASMRHTHRPPLSLEQFAGALSEGMASALNERKAFTAWTVRKIAAADLAGWVDGPVAAWWGPLAAARVHHIATTGTDGTPMRSFQRATPHEWPLMPGTVVPGTHAPCEDGYQIAQVLAWMAAQRTNVAERFAWRTQINPLMSQLIH
jgi:uncharacterized protein DUF932